MENGLGLGNSPSLIYDKKSKGGSGGGANNSGSDSGLHGKKSSAKNHDVIDLFFQDGDYTIKMKVFTHATESMIRANISYSRYENILEDIKQFFEKVWAVFIDLCVCVLFFFFHNRRYCFVFLYVCV